MEAIYVLSDPDSVKQGKYKIGITTRKKELLLRDYTRSRPEVELYLFENCKNSRELEKIILDKFKNYRIKHKTSERFSEWVKLDLNIIIKEIIYQLKDNKFFNNSLICENDDILKDKKDQVVFDKIPNLELIFMNNSCNLYWNYSESCKDLYDEYFKQGGKFTKINFCKYILNQLTIYYKCEKDSIRYKINKLTYYKGIQLKKNQKNYTCIII
jgi:hypothetical protein